MRLYSCENCENLLSRYVTLYGGNYVTLIEGSLGYGLTVAYAEGFETAVIKEVPLNEWSSAHTIRFYKKVPKKYEKMLEAYFANGGKD